MPTRKSKNPAISRRDTDVTTENMNTIEEVEQIQNGFKYMRLLGQLNYLTNSRPDILPAVSFVATKSKNNNKQDFQDLLLIVAYLRQTSDYGLTLHPKREGDSESLKLTAFVDAAYMSHSDAS